MDQKDQVIAELRQIIRTLTESNDALSATIKELQETIRELQRQLNQNSNNSSKPPSSDGFNKPAPKSLRKKSGKKPGGQTGHPGAHMAIPHDPDDYKTHLPHKCISCPRLTKCMKSGKVFTCGEKRYEVNAVVTTTVTEHQAMDVTSCPCGNGKLKGEFPGNIKAYVQYGDSVTVLVGLLNTYGAVSAMRIHTLIGSLLGVSLSTGTINAMSSKCANKVGGTLEKIRKMLAGSDVCHFDETGTDVNGKTIWVHNSSTTTLTYQTINKKRGQIGMEAGGVLPEFSGIAVHDCWASYWKYEDIRHAVCNAHLLRELTGVEEYSCEHTWATEFKKFLIAMKTAKEKALSKGMQKLSYYYLHKFVTVS